MDLACDARTLLGDRTPELGELDRAPRADEDDDVREHAQEVALRHVRAREQRLEHELQRGEEHQGEAEREPAREVVAAAHEACAPADDGDERDERLQSERTGEIERLRLAGRRTEARERRAERAQERPGDEERDAGCGDRVRDRPLAVLAAAAAERGDRDQGLAEDRADQRRPGLGGQEVAAAEPGPDRKDRRRERGDEEAAREQEVDAPAFDRVAGRGEHRHEQACERHRRLEHEPQLRQVVVRPQARIGEEERKARAEEAREQDFSPEPALVHGPAVLSHLPLVGRRLAADKRQELASRILIVDDHPLTREALSSLLGAHGFDVVGLASDGAQAIVEAARLRPDVILLDLSMPGLDGLAALPRLREAAPECEVVVLTASGTEENLLQAIRAGAAGYLLKTEPPEKIAAFLDGVVNGEAALSGSVARRLLDQVRVGNGRGSGVPDAIAGALSAREVEVLLLLDEHLGTDEIAKRLFISEHTVRSHVKSLLRKLGVSSRRDALESLAVARAA